MANTKHEFNIRTRNIKERGGVVEPKPSCPPEGNSLKIPNDGEKEQASNPKKYRGKKPQNKPSP